MSRPTTKTKDGYNRPFAIRLRTLLKERKISQQTLATAIGIRRQSINAYATGETIPDIDRLVQIAKYFDVSYDYLLGESDVQKREQENVETKISYEETVASYLIRLKDLQYKFNEVERIADNLQKEEPNIERLIEKYKQMEADKSRIEERKETCV